MLLVLRYPVEQPLIEVNPAGFAILDVDPMAAGESLRIDAVRRSVGAGGKPFAAVATNMRTVAGKQLRITAGRLMSERTRTLDAYRRWF